MSHYKGIEPSLFTNVCSIVLLTNYPLQVKMFPVRKATFKGSGPFVMLWVPITHGSLGQHRVFVFNESIKSIFLTTICCHKCTFRFVKEHRKNSGVNSVLNYLCSFPWFNQLRWWIDSRSIITIIMITPCNLSSLRRIHVRTQVSNINTNVSKMFQQQLGWEQWWNEKLILGLTLLHVPHVVQTHRQGKKQPNSRFSSLHNTRLY